MNPEALVRAVADRVRASLPPGLAARDQEGLAPYCLPSGAINPDSAGPPT